MPRSKESFETMRQATRQKIEAAALSLFARKGLSVKVGEIAEEAGASMGLMYSHYPSKDALIAELIRQATSISSKAIIDFSIGENSAAGKINTISSMMCKMFSEGPTGIDYFMFMAQVGMSDFAVPEEIWYSKGLPNPVDTFALIIAQGQAEGSAVDGAPLQLSIVYWAAVQGLCSYAATGVQAAPSQQMLSRIILKEEYL